MYSRGLSLPSGRSVTLQSRPTTNNYFNYRLFNASFCLWNMKHFCIFTWLIQIVCFIQSTVQHPKIFNVLTYTTKYQILVFQDLEREWVVQFVRFSYNAICLCTCWWNKIGWMRHQSNDLHKQHFNDVNNQPI